MINQFSIPIGRTIGIIDRSGTVIACSDAMKVGDVYEDAVEELIYGQNCVKANGKVLRAINAESGWEHIVFVDGDDDAAEKYSELLAISIANVKQYYDEKFGKANFIKNVIADNILPLSAIAVAAVPASEVSTTYFGGIRSDSAPPIGRASTAASAKAAVRAPASTGEKP